MYKFTTMPDESELKALGFKKMDSLLPPCGVSLKDEVYIGQKDEEGRPRPVWCYVFPNSETYARKIILNYRGELHLVSNTPERYNIRLDDVSDETVKDYICYCESESWNKSFSEMLEKLIALGLKMDEPFREAKHIPFLSINPKLLPLGSVVYYVQKRGHEWSVGFGTVLEHYSHSIEIQLYELSEFRLVNGIPYNDFETPTRWQKLPKGWTYNTKLYSVTHKEHPDLREYDIRKPGDILKAIADGCISKVQDMSHSYIDEEICKDKGWRLVKKYNDMESKSEIVQKL